MHHIRLVTFGVKSGVPDIRFHQTYDCKSGIKNPHTLPLLRRLTGRDAKVQAYVISSPAAQKVVQNLVSEATPDTTVGLFCYGGRHRSVAIAEQAAEVLRQMGWQVTVEHRSLDKLE